MRKQFVAVVVAVLLSIAIAPSTAAAADPPTVDGFQSGSIYVLSVAYYNNMDVQESAAGTFAAFKSEVLRLEKLGYALDPSTVMFMNGETTAYAWITAILRKKK